MAFQQYPQKLGIPSGATAARPSSPVIGDTFYNGTLEILEIWNGSAWVAVSAPPATPSIATPTDASTADAYTSTAGKLSVVFTPGSGGGTPNQYNAYTTSGGFTGFSATNTVVISGLEPGTAYTVYGNAQNNFGTTVNTANATAVTPSTLPQVRTIGTATTSGVTTSVTVTWTNGSNGGKNLSAITITPFLNGTTAETSQTASTTSSTSHTFTGLTIGNSYTFKVKATNANGTCADSTATNSVTIPDPNVSVQYLVIAGGGSGGGHGGSGAGAGGYRCSVTGETSGRGASAESPANFLKGNAYTITVGGGGATVYNAPGNDGANSSISGSGLTTITSLGGARGRSSEGVGGGVGNGFTGGCGGGAATQQAGTTSYNGGAGTTAQGYDGGGSVPAYNDGGGGGAGAVGGTGTTSPNVAGSGGSGQASSITGSSVTRAGGGGGSSQSGTNGNGGSGGGGAASGGNATAGTANTGSGGGGSHGGGTTYSGAGGSGVVILRATVQATSTTGSPTYTTSGSWHIYQFNGDGSITY